ncbi:hypothetical protein PILCRDRAFT_464079 [Piloderma croceum F 1598]|uniref:Uncharacterized protein n=1 Tax=Piloderma croceum (strain F 1598) TaxID=765440 RepID=A0A0C3FCP5_PILCF|nr:hypothetical protein PILCRDRAFT_464079 [Piloderma croceum F 1598]
MSMGGQFLNERTAPILTIYCTVPRKVSQMGRLFCPSPVISLKDIDVGTKEYHFLSKSHLGLNSVTMGWERKPLGEYLAFQCDGTVLENSMVYTNKYC